MRAIADSDKFAEKQFKDVKITDHAHKALALRCGVFNLQVSPTTASDLTPAKLSAASASANAFPAS